MATTQPTDTLDRATRRATVRRLADEEHLSARAIARRLGIGKDTVRRDLDATAPTSAPPVPTSGAPRAPYLLYDLEPSLIQDLNALTDPRTGALIEPVRRYIRAAAEGRRTGLRKVAQRLAEEDE